MLVWKQVEFSLNSHAHTRGFEQSRDLRQPALRIPRLSCVLTHEANPGCAVRTNLLWTSLRQITATKLQHTLPRVNWPFAITTAAGFAPLSLSLSLLILPRPLPVSLLFSAFTTLTHVPLHRNHPQKPKAPRWNSKEGCGTFVAGKRKANTLTNKQQVCHQVVEKKSTTVQDFTGIGVQTPRREVGDVAKGGANRWPTSDFPEEDLSNFR